MTIQFTHCNQTTKKNYHSLSHTLWQRDTKVNWLQTHNETLRFTHMTGFKELRVKVHDNSPNICNWIWNFVIQNHPPLIQWTFYNSTPTLYYFFFTAVQYLQMILPLECLGAQSALVLSLIAVNELVFSECTRVVERLGAHTALYNRSTTSTSWWSHWFQWPTFAPLTYSCLVPTRHECSTNTCLTILTATCCTQQTVKKRRSSRDII